MSPKNQAPKKTRRWLRREIVDRDLTVRELARRVGHHESVVSKAINHDMFPLVHAKIVEALHA